MQPVETYLQTLSKIYRNGAALLNPPITRCWELW
jgi:hypothetical protein